MTRERFRVYVICRELPIIARPISERLMRESDFAVVAMRPIGIGDVLDAAAVVDPGKPGQRMPKANTLRCIALEHEGKIVTLEEFAS